MESVRQGIGKTDKDWGIVLLEDNGIRAILAEVDNDDGAFCS
jgi:hypothetical protein